MNLTCTTESLLKRTTSRCPVCHASVPAEVWKVSEGCGGDSAAPAARVFLRRTCPEHGKAEACIASDARFYWLAQGDPKNQCCGGTCHAAEGDATGTLGRNASASQPSTLNSQPAAERLSTCLALIEIVNSCNLACPTCYADSPMGAGGTVDAVPLADVQRRIQGVIDRKGRIEILQLSGGEPTLHPQFFELLAWLHAHPGIDYVLLNTNGVRIANDDAFLDSLGKTFRAGKFQLYLQFDGVQEAAQRALRGGDLREMRKRAIERCGTLNIPITLAMTVTPENLPHLWDTVEFGLGFDHVRGVSFQPMFTERTRLRASQLVQGAHQPAQLDLNTADVILALVAQSAVPPPLRGLHPAALRRSELRDHRLPFENRRHRRADALDQRLRGLPPGAGFPPRQSPLHPRRPRPLRLRKRTPRRTAARAGDGNAECGTRSGD